MEIPLSGAVFVFGKCNVGQNQLNHFYIKNDNIVSVHCGNNYSAIVCESGSLYTFGTNNFGQLGLGHKNSVNKPTIVKALKSERVLLVACGQAHTLILTENSIYGCGKNDHGQLGVAVTENCTVPKKLQDAIFEQIIQDNNFKKLTAGKYHSALLTKDGKVFVWGSNLQGQLGLGSEFNDRFKPVQVKVPDFIMEIACGYYHTLLIAQNGKIISFGESSNGKLGFELHENTMNKPQTAFDIANAADVYSGSNHNFIISTDGKLHGFGSNLLGQLGLKNDVTWTTKLIEISLGKFDNDLIQKIVCGESHTAFLTISGKLFTCGDTRFGKLCLGNPNDQDIIYEPQLVKKFVNYKIIDVACGTTHTLILACKRPLVSARQKINLNERFQKPQIPKLDIDIDETSLKSVNKEEEFLDENGKMDKISMENKGKVENSSSYSFGNNKVHSELSNYCYWILTV